MKRAYWTLKSKAILSLTAVSLLTPSICSSQDASPFYEPKIESKEKSPKSEEGVTFQVTIAPRHQTSLSAEIASPVTKVNKKMGQTFKKGEVLIQLNDVLFQSNLKKAEAALEKAKVEFDAKKQLFQDNVASLFELKEGKANVATAQADLALAKRNLDGTTIKAPYDGKVISVEIEQYETPQLGKSLIEIVDDEILIAKFLIPSTLLPKISVGMPFDVSVRETGEKVSTKISRIGSVIDPSSGTVKIEADIDNSKSLLRSGMSGKAIFNFTEK